VWSVCGAWRLEKVQKTERGGARNDAPTPKSPISGQRHVTRLVLHSHGVGAVRRSKRSAAIRTNPKRNEKTGGRTVVYEKTWPGGAPQSCQRKRKGARLLVLACGSRRFAHLSEFYRKKSGGGRAFMITSPGLHEAVAVAPKRPNQLPEISNGGLTCNLGGRFLIQSGSLRELGPNGHQRPTVFRSRTVFTERHFGVRCRLLTSFWKAGLHHWAGRAAKQSLA